MDDALRHGLWNALHICIWEQIEHNAVTVLFVNTARDVPYRVAYPLCEF